VRWTAGSDLMLADFTCEEQWPRRRMAHRSSVERISRGLEQETALSIVLFSCHGLLLSTKPESVTFQSQSIPVYLRRILAKPMGSVWLEFRQG
jgi:hypothetical protein